ncbi:MAG: spermidine/putrescine transport system permease protein [Actinomycetota bacterium]|nr:spermidine/putrescine transport system permease protein [Actinomycetota bacterium]
MRGPGGWYRDPWRKARVLQIVTWAYLAWSLVPVLVAILISFNAGRSAGTFQGFSLQWWNGAPQGDTQGSLFTSPELHAALIQTLRLSIIAMIIAVPLGVAFAIGLDRWRGRVASTANFFMLVSFVVPEIIIGVALFYTFTYTLNATIKLGTLAQIIGLVAFQISYPVIVVRARLLSIGKEYEEAAMDLGAPPRAAIRRVLLPMLYPAIFASFALVFADVIDDFVTVRYLSAGSSTESLSVKIYSAVRGTPTPVYNAAATFMLFTTVIAIAFVYVLYKQFGKGQTGSAAEFTTQL